MYKCINNIIVTAIFLLLLSCNKNTGQNVSFDLDSFVSNKVFTFEMGEKYIVDEQFVGVPSSIKIFKPGVFIVKENKVMHHINMIDMNRGISKQYITRGKGPGELIDVRDIEITGNNLLVSSISESKVIKLAYDTINSDFEITDILDFSGNGFMRAIPLHGGTQFLTQCAPISNNRVEIIDLDKNVLFSSDKFPSVNSSNNFTPNNAFFQSDITVSPDNKNIAVVSKSVDAIDLYDNNLKFKKEIVGPLGIETTFSVINTPAGNRFRQDPMYFVYETARSVDDIFFVSYNGIELNKDTDLTRYARNIFSFDWDGNPLVNYSFDFPVISFDVDWKNKKMFCLTHNPEPVILMFNL